MEVLKFLNPKFTEALKFSNSKSLEAQTFFNYKSMKALKFYAALLGYGSATLEYTYTT
jgi:hypothetical protein